MFSAAYIAQQCPAIFADNSARGFHDEYRTPRIIQGLIASEIIEGFEALRKNKLASRDTVKALKDRFDWTDAPAGEYPGSLWWREDFAADYGRYVKDTVEAEMAGTCIRCFDAIGMRLHEGGGQFEDVGIGRADGLSLEDISEAAAKRIALCLEGAHQYTDAANIALFPEILVSQIPVCFGIQDAPSDYTQIHGVAPFITELNSYVETLKNMALVATWYGIDLLTHIELEVAYNRTREYQHGGKRF